DFFQVDGSAGLPLYLLDDLPLWSDDGADEFLVDEDLHHSRSMRFHIGSRRGHALIHGVQYMKTSFTGLFQRCTHGVHAEAVDFYVHLYATDALTGTGDLEVHIPQVIFITQDICKDSIFSIGGT